MSGACDAGSGSARRRRERRLLSWLRHERMTVRMELTAALHHSAFKGAGFETHDAPRSQKTVNSKRDAELFSLFEEEIGGTRPDRLSNVRPQERVQRPSDRPRALCSGGAGPRRSCAAGGGTAGRRPRPGGKEGK